ncbi:MAG: PilN domain-containing protein [Rhodospirillales bacterium]
MDQLKSVLLSFLRWWLGELRACLPSRLRRFLTASRNRLVFDVSDSVVVVSEVNGGGEREIGHIVRDQRQAADPADRVRGLLAHLDARRRDIVVRLPPSMALRRKIELPSAAEENLREVVSFDMERQTPFSADQVYFDARLVRRLPEKQRIVADLVLVPKTLADPAISLLASWSVVPHYIELPGTADRSPQVVALAAQLGAVPAAKGVHRLSWGLAGLAALLVVAIAAVPLLRQHRQLASLDAQVEQAKKEADAARKTQDQIDNLAALDRFLVERKEARPARIAVLDEISRILPDDTWLFRLRLAGDEVQTFGYSAGASNLIGPLEESPLFRNPQFLAPLMRDQRVDAERFHIAFQLEGAPS